MMNVLELDQPELRAMMEAAVSRNWQRSTAASVASTAIEPATPAAATVDASAERAAGAKAERTRIAGIFGHDAAAGRPKLAKHLALETDTSAEAAAGILSASAEEGSDVTAPMSAPGAKSAAVSPAIDVDGLYARLNGTDAWRSDLGEANACARSSKPVIDSTDIYARRAAVQRPN